MRALFARLRLLDPERFPDLDCFRREAHAYRKVARDGVTALAKLDLEGQVALAGRFAAFEIIVVDDGIATGNTIIAGVKMLRKHHPGKIVVAVPVAPPQVVGKMNDLADEFICPETPSDFYGVGQYYFDFSEVTDDDVLKLLRDTQ